MLQLQFLADLAKLGGSLARQHRASLTDKDVTEKGVRDYVTVVDQRIEDELVARIRKRHPDHRILGEEGRSGAQPIAGPGPLWIIDPIDGTTNFLHGLPGYAVSIAFCDGATARWGAVYDPERDELFTAERGSGVWLNGQRRYCSSCAELGKALVATALPFRFPQVMTDGLRVFGAVQRACDDQRRSGSAALDLAYVAVGRLDAYYELGIHPWDTAAGELLVASGGGAATDFHGRGDDVEHRRSILAAATPALHAALMPHVTELAPWLALAPFCPPKA